MTDVARRPGDPHERPGPPEAGAGAASEEITEVAPGVLRMQLPIWMPGLGHVNMYGLSTTAASRSSTPASPVRRAGRR